MDKINDENLDICTEYIYSEDYLDFIFRYDDYMFGVYEDFNPECINNINNRFLIAYKKSVDFNEKRIFRYGYNSVPKCFGLMDTTVASVVGADVVRRISGLALTGKDTIVGFVDTGINYTSETFIKKDGTTRIKSIWDQNKSVLGSGPKAFGYGAVFYEEDINEALKSNNPFERVPTIDEEGHGTFLASVACGNESGEKFTGIAPECDIIMVKLKEAKRNLREFYLINDDAKCYSEADIMLGIRFLLKEAARLGKPIVICLGLGSSSGDHNGNTNLEMYFDMTQNLRGVCVVSAAGNELGYGGHYSAERKLSSNEGAERVEIYVGPGDKGFTMEIWGNAPGILSISILSPTGEKFGNISSIKNDSTRISFLYEGTKVYIENIAVERQSGDQMIFFRFSNPSEGIWTIEVSENVLGISRGFDAWLPIHDFLNSNVTFIRSEPDVTICAPGNSRGAITVAGYNHYNNAIYINSSRGFSRKGEIKPDITAPAVDVYGIFSTGTNLLGKNSLYTRKDGTSIAAAITSGVAALLLEWGFIRGNNPDLDTPTIKQMLIRGAKENIDIIYPSEAWGWGLLDIFETFETMRETI